MSEPTLYSIHTHLYRRERLAPGQPVCKGCAFEERKGSSACRVFPCLDCRNVAKAIPDDMQIPTDVKVIEFDMELRA